MTLDLDGYRAKRAEWLAAVRAAQAAHDARNAARDTANALSDEEARLRAPIDARASELRALLSPSPTELAELAELQDAISADGG